MDVEKLVRHPSDSDDVSLEDQSSDSDGDEAGSTRAMEVDKMGATPPRCGASAAEDAGGSQAAADAAQQGRGREHQDREYQVPLEPTWVECYHKLHDELWVRQGWPLEERPTPAPDASPTSWRLRHRCPSSAACRCTWSTRKLATPRPVGRRRRQSWRPSRSRRCGTRGSATRCRRPRPRRAPASWAAGSGSAAWTVAWCCCRAPPSSAARHGALGHGHLALRRGRREGGNRHQRPA